MSIDTIQICQKGLTNLTFDDEDFDRFKELRLYQIHPWNYAITIDIIHVWTNSTQTFDTLVDLWSIRFDLVPAISS